ncbi:MAG: glycosyltransferase [Clostridia bacterium]|nr:glycosyltransferase [Clostridia bacterium]
MKLVKISSAYLGYLNKFYLKRPELKDQGYLENKKALDYDAYGWTDFWGFSLRPLGYEVSEFLSNDEILQKKWAVENGVSFEENNWLLDIVEEQVKAEKPDILFMNDYVTFTEAWLKELRQKCPSIKIILGWCGAPYKDQSVFNAYDVVLSCIPELTDKFNNDGHSSYQMHHAFDPRILDRINVEKEKSIGFSFIGGISRNSQFHMEREMILLKLTKMTDIQMFSPSAEFGIKDDLRVLAKKGAYGIVSALRSIGAKDSFIDRIPNLKNINKFKSSPLMPVNRKLKKYMNNPVFGLDMFQKLRDSKVTFNNHIDISSMSASNMRLFEATGVGTCLITDHKKNITDIFEPDKEVVTYKTVDECIEKVKWLLEHQVERENIAKLGQKRTLEEHTFKNRASVLDQIIRKHLH